MITHASIEAESLLSDNDILDITLEREQQMIEAIEEWLEGILNPLIIRGPAGTGKTETVKQMAIEAGITSTDIVSSDIEENGGELHVKTVKGALHRTGDYSNWALFADLYANRSEGLLVLDDNDNILMENVGAALILKATEKQPLREMTFTKAARIDELKKRGVPPVFETRCPIAILTNIDMKLAINAADFRQKESGRVPPGYIKRYKALMSRGTYIDLELNTPRAIRVFCENKIIAAKILTQSPFLEDKFGRSLTQEENSEVLKWIRFNQGKLADALDIRTYQKVATTMLKRKKDWEQSAKVRYLKPV